MLCSNRFVQGDKKSSQKINYNEVRKQKTVLYLSFGHVQSVKKFDILLPSLNTEGQLQ
jgi:hypothetical protein